MRRSLAGSLLIGALLLTGCMDPAEPSAGSATPSTAAASPSAAPLDARDDMTVVKEAFDRGFAERTFNMGAEIRAGGRHVVKIDAVVDVEADVVQMIMMADEYVEMLKFADEIYIKDTDAPGPDTFLRVEVGKLNANSSLRGSFDLSQHSGILGGVLQARKTDEQADERTYEGTADLRKAMEAAPAASRASMESTVRLARNADAVPFKLTVDDRGRLLSLFYEIETAQGTIASRITMHGYGRDVAVDRPKPEQVKDATEEQYAVL